MISAYANKHTPRDVHSEFSLKRGVSSRVCNVTNNINTPRGGAGTLQVLVTW